MGFVPEIKYLVSCIMLNKLPSFEFYVLSESSEYDEMARLQTLQDFTLSVGSLFRVSHKYSFIYTATIEADII